VTILNNILVIGLGEVGRPVFELLKMQKAWKVFGYDKDQNKTIHNLDEIPKTIYALHICIPCSDTKPFINTVCDLVCEFEPKLLIIHSTVPPLTTRIIYEEISRECSYVAHSPVRGVHFQMVEDMKDYIKFVGGATPEGGKEAFNHLIKAGFKCKLMRTSTNTELAKLFETGYASTMIAMFQEMHRISKQFGVDFSDILDIFIDTHIHRLDRPIYHPSVIGGHCLMPNIVLLNQSVNSGLFRWVEWSNELRIAEMQDPEIAKEVAECKKKWDAMRKWSAKVLGKEGKI
jgi:UDP-N-acetyl-D-mannosaminuronate dehydrogenase